jgi:hypothetical protein
MIVVGYGEQIVHTIDVIAGRISTSRTLLVSADGDVGRLGGGGVGGCRRAGGSEMKRSSLARAGMCTNR